MNHPASLESEGEAHTPHLQSSPSSGSEPEREQQAEHATSWLSRHRILRDILIMMSGTGGAQVITLLGYLVLARIYTASDFGVLSIVISVGTLGAVLAAGRYDPAVMLPKEDAEAKQVVRLALTLSTIFSTLFLVATLIFAFLGWRAGYHAAPLFILSALFVAANSLTSVWTFWLNRSGRYTQISQNRIFSALAQVVLQIGAWAVGIGGALGITAGRVFGVVAATFTLGHRARASRVGVDRSRGARRRVMKRYRKMPLLNGPTAIADAVRLNGINILIGALFSTAALGQFSFAWMVVQAPVTLINGAVSQVYFRELTHTPPGTLLAAARRVTLRGFALGFLPFAALAALAPWLFPSVFGPHWSEAGIIATLLCPWLYLNLVTSPVSNIFVVTETQQVSLWFSLVFMAVPLSLIALSFHLHFSIIFTTGILSASMTLLLAVFIVLAFMVARRFDTAAA